MPSAKKRPLRLRSLRVASLRTCMIRGLRGLAISAGVLLGIGGSWRWAVLDLTPGPFPSGKGSQDGGGWPPPQPSLVPTGEGVRRLWLGGGLDRGYRCWRGWWRASGLTTCWGWPAI